MKYTVRFAHMFKRSPLKVGDSVAFGDLIGIMGSTGQSKHNHVHMDLVEGFVKKIIRLKQIGEDKKYIPSYTQLMYFFDKDLFGIEPVLTTPYMDPEYRAIFGKDHPAIDLVPIDRHYTTDHFNFSWNRIKVKNTEVLFNLFDKNGYGNTVGIGFETL